MAAYVIVEADVSDPDQYEKYKAAALAAVTAHGGRYIARGGEVRVFEGSPPTARVVLLEFADLDAAEAWYRSDDYRAARAIREHAATLRMLAVAGS